MEHVRTSALRAVISTLTGIPGIKGVSARRRWSYVEDHLPAINAHWANEKRGKVHGMVPGRRMLDRDMLLRVNIVTYVHEDPEADPPEYELDAWQAEVEARLAANFRLVGPEGTPSVRDTLWEHTETGESTKGGAGAVLVTALYFEVLTHHREGRPTNPLQD